MIVLDPNLAKLCCYQDFQQNDGDSHKEAVLFNAQYRDLVCLVNYQREKLSTQQAELTKVLEMTGFLVLHYVVMFVLMCLYYTYDLFEGGCLLCSAVCVVGLCLA